MFQTQISHEVVVEKLASSLASVTHLEHCPGNGKVIGSILVRAHAQTVGSVPSWGMSKRQLIDVSLSH